VRDHHEQEVSQVELFLNQVKLLANLTHDEKMRLLDALEEVTFQPGTSVIKQVPFPQPVLQTDAKTAPTNGPNNAPPRLRL